MALAGEGPTMSMTNYYTEPEQLAVTVSDAARMMGLKDNRTVRHLMRNGELKGRKVGRIYLVTVRSIRDYLGA